MLRKEHVTALVRARALAQQYEQLASAEPGYENGKFAEACKACDAAIFNVLVIARAWLKVDISNDDLYS